MTEVSLRELQRISPHAELVTGFQMADEFRKRVRIQCLPMELSYWRSGSDVDCGLRALGIAKFHSPAGKAVCSPPYIEEVAQRHVVVDFSGDMYYGHEEGVGLVALYSPGGEQGQGEIAALLWQEECLTEEIFKCQHFNQYAEREKGDEVAGCLARKEALEDMHRKPGLASQGFYKENSK